MRLLITGAGGFIGQHIAAKLIGDGHEVHLVGSPKTIFSEQLEQQAASVHSIDISEPDEFEHLSKIVSLDAVIHCAGIAHRFGKTDESVYSKINVEGTVNVMNFAAGKNAAHVIHFSSVLVYGRRDDKNVITESTPVAPYDAYGESKLKSEEKAAEICKSKDIDLTILRPAPVLGKGSKGNFGRLVSAVAKKRFVKIGAGKNRKSFVYVEDIAEACALLLSEKKTGIEIFNLAGNAVTVDELVDQLSIELNSKLLPLRLSPSLLKAGFGILKLTPLRAKADSVSRSLATWLSDDVYSAELIKERYDFSAKTDTKDAIRKEAEFYKERSK